MGVADETISSWLSEAVVKKVSSAPQAIAEKLRTANVLKVDELGVMVGGRIHSPILSSLGLMLSGLVPSASPPLATHYTSPKDRL